MLGAGTDVGTDAGQGVTNLLPAASTVQRVRTAAGPPR
jgi:hypothetical protein